MAKQPAALSFDTVLGAARDINRAFDRWNMADGPYVSWDGVATKGMSKELYEGIPTCVDKTADKGLNVDPKARRLMLVLDDIAIEFKRWMQGFSQGLSTCPPRGSEALNNALRRLKDILAERPLPPPEPLESLVKLGAPHHQIAIKYGWKTPEGAPDVERVMAAIADPAAHTIDPKTWIHPSQANAIAEADKAWEGRAPRPEMFRREPEGATKPKNPSIEEMIKAHATPQQIARVHKLDVEMVLEMASEMGIDLNAPRHVKPVTEAGMQQEMIAQHEAAQRAAAGLE